LRSSNVEAYLAYLRGRSMLGRLSIAESKSAAVYFEKAIALDPQFAAAYASLYDARMQAADLQHQDLAPLRRQFRPLIDRALAIDPNSGAAYFARAMWGDAPYAARNADFLRGVTLDPSNGRGLTAYAEYLDNEDFGWLHTGWANVDHPVQYEEAKRILQRAVQIDPMSPGARFDLATAGIGGGSATLEQNMLAILELDPEFVPALFQVGKYRWMFHGKLTDAIQILERAIALDPANPEPRHGPCRVSGSRRRAGSARGSRWNSGKCTRRPPGFHVSRKMARSRTFCLRRRRLDLRLLRQLACRRGAARLRVEDRRPDTGDCFHT
jgi:tetratricopeptide (TPR) repeat protein